MWSKCEVIVPILWAAKGAKRIYKLKKGYINFKGQTHTRIGIRTANAISNWKGVLHAKRCQKHKMVYIVVKVIHTCNGLLARVNYTRNGLNATNDVKNSKGYKILIKVKHTRDGLNATNDVKHSKVYKILVNVKNPWWSKRHKRSNLKRV